MSNKPLSMGIILVGAALVLLLGKIGFFTFIGSLLWPLVLLVLPGFVLHALVFNRTLPSAAVFPGGVLVTYGILFFLCSLFGWGLMSILWPGFIFGIAVGLYELVYFEKGRDNGLRMIAIGLALVSVVLLLFNLVFTVSVYVFIVLLLAAGVVLIVSGKRIW